MLAVWQVGHQKVLSNLQTESQQTRSQLLLLIRWRPLLITTLHSQVAERKQCPRHPEQRGGHAMAIRKSVKHWLMKLTVNLLSLVFCCMTLSYCLLFSPYIQYCISISMCCWCSQSPSGGSIAIERGALGIVWSRLRWSSFMSTVPKAILQQCSITCPFIPKYHLYEYLFVQLEKPSYVIYFCLSDV